MNAELSSSPESQRLEALIQRLWEVKGWQKLLAKPRSQRRNGRKRR